MTQPPGSSDDRYPDPLLRQLGAGMGRSGYYRRERMVEEIRANRRGLYKVPTWVLALVLVAMIAGIVVALSLV